MLIFFKYTQMYSLIQIQDESAVYDFVKSDGEENEIINSAWNNPDVKENYDNGNINTIATYKRERLEGKFVSSNVINLSRRNLSEAEISLLYKSLKFVPTVNKIDRTKLKTELEEYGRKLSGLCGILETMKKHFHMRSLDLSLHSTQGTRILLLNHI